MRVKNRIPRSIGPSGLIRARLIAQFSFQWAEALWQAAQIEHRPAADRGGGRARAAWAAIR